jgi:hypothetical protein
MSQQSHDTDQQRRILEAAVRMHGGMPSGEINPDSLPTLSLRPLFAMLFIVGIPFLMMFFMR